MPELTFIPNVAGEGEGLSDAGIETYRDNPFPAVARETGQNSRDAHDSERRGDEPVRVVIDKISVPATSLPAHSSYLAVVRRCLHVAQESGTDKEIAFFRQAERVLTAPEIPILRIADFHTRGLRGPCVEGRPFHALVKSSGISDKQNDTSGGSFGIGKSAVYSASDLQTVFYSTLYEGDNQELQFLCQGKTKFRSFTDEKGEAFRSIGYWGDPAGFLPVDDAAQVPEWLRREEIGTTVCSIAVRDTDEWQKEIVTSIVTNFFSAIHAETMEFEVDGDVINAHNLRRRFEDVAKAVTTLKEDFNFARSMYECLTDDHETEEHRLEIPNVGAFSLRILIRDGLPKRVGILRNGMYICDSLSHFGDKFRHFPMYRDFVALVEPCEEGSNAWLRAMENPRHDELSPERLLQPEKRKAAKREGTYLAEKVRAAISHAAKSAKEQDTDLEELSEFFALDDQGKEDESGARKVESFKVRTPTSRKRTRQTRTPIDEVDGEEGGGARGENPGTGAGGGAGPGSGDSGTGTGTKSRKQPLPLMAPRTITVPTDLHERRVIFTPAESGVALLRFESSGVSDPAPLELAEGECRVTCVGNQRQEILVRFKEPYDGPLEILSWREEEVQQ